MCFSGDAEPIVKASVDFKCRFEFQTIEIFVT